MQRNDLLNAIDELKDSDNIEHAIHALKDLAVTFCDKYESEFNDIRYSLEDLAPHIDKVHEAHVIAERCSERLY